MSDEHPPQPTTSRIFRRRRKPTLHSGTSSNPSQSTFDKHRSDSSKAKVDANSWSPWSGPPREEVPSPPPEDDGVHPLLTDEDPKWSHATLQRAYSSWMHLGGKNSFIDVLNYYIRLEELEKTMSPEARAASQQCEKELIDNKPPSSKFFDELYGHIYRPPKSSHEGSADSTNSTKSLSPRRSQSSLETWSPSSVLSDASTFVLLDLQVKPPTPKETTQPSGQPSVLKLMLQGPMVPSPQSPLNPNMPTSPSLMTPIQPMPLGPITPAPWGPMNGTPWGPITPSPGGPMPPPPPLSEPEPLTMEPSATGSLTFAQPLPERTMPPVNVYASSLLAAILGVPQSEYKP